ncbi:MAG: SDR family NAD(P)-dependent oxidoreductase [Hyphomonadaceae bacterium]
MSGKVIVITGGFGALGRAASSCARAAGWKVACIDYAAAPADFASDALATGGVDLSDAAAAAAAISAVVADAGRIDALFNIAGAFAWRPLGEEGSVLWEEMFAANTKTAANACQAALPHLVASGGAIVNVGAASALRAGVGLGPYAAAKSGVHRLTESLAEELKGRVRVNAVLPSILDTPRNRADMPGADFSAWVEPEDLARVMLFLASDDARAITGALLPVTGRL